MVKQIEAYKCDLCGKVIVGSLKKAEAHERIPKTEALPKGFVYRPEGYIDSYMIVTGGESKINFSHGYQQLGLLVSPNCHSILNEKWEILQSENVHNHTRLINDEDLEEVRQFFNSHRCIYRNETKVNSRDLTNKL